MKKRWDGHNSGGYDNRPLEKIKVQLQKLEGNQWKEFKSDDYYSPIYYTNISRTDGNKAPDISRLNKDALFASNPTNKLTITLNGQEVVYQVPQGKYAGKYIDKDVLANATWYKDTSDVNRDNRLQLYLTPNQTNNIVLNLSGKNNPQHFTNGYYYKWDNLPYGQYRVVETASFYDVNNNDIYEEGIDRDTSEEYNYMVFPPSRDSNGVLHIQNFTKDVVLDI